MIIKIEGQILIVIFSKLILYNKIYEIIINTIIIGFILDITINRITGNNLIITEFSLI